MFLAPLAAIASQGPDPRPARARFAADNKRPQGFVSLSTDELSQFGIRLATAGSAEIRQFIELPGETHANVDKIAHIVSRYPEIVIDVRKKIGDLLASTSSSRQLSIGDSPSQTRKPGQRTNTGEPELHDHNHSHLSSPRVPPSRVSWPPAAVQLSSNRARVEMSAEDRPISTSNVPGSATQSPFCGSQKESARRSIVKQTSCSSPGSRKTRAKAASSFSGRATLAFTSRI